jgi:hypothetical protein
MPISVAKAKMLVAWPDGNEAQSESKAKGLKSSGPTESNSLGRALPTMFLVRLAMRPAPPMPTKTKPMVLAIRP